MLAGPSGVGKTYVASGLCADAIEHGYKGYFRTMESIMNTLKTRDATPYARAEYRNLCAYSGAMSASNSSLKKVKMMLDHL